MKLNTAAASIATAAVLGPFVAGSPTALGDEGEQFNACVLKRKSGGQPAGALRIVDTPRRCKRRERAIVLGSAGPAGAPGPTGAKGDTGPAGSPDAPQDILTKLLTVDGQGSDLTADLFDGLDSTAFVRTSTPAGGEMTGTFGALDVDEQSLEQVPAAANADALGGQPASVYVNGRQFFVTASFEFNGGFGVDSHLILASSHFELRYFCVNSPSGQAAELFLRYLGPHKNWALGVDGVTSTDSGTHRGTILSASGLASTVVEQTDYAAMGPATGASVSGTAMAAVNWAGRNCAFSGSFLR